MDELLALFTRASKLMRGAADAALSRHGVRVGQNLLLEALWERDGQTPGELAERLRVAPPTVVKMTGRMQAAGLVTRRRDPRDARLVRIHLTDRGQSLRGPVEDELLRLRQAATAELTAAQRRELGRALTTVIENLEALGPVDEEPAEDEGP